MATLTVAYRVNLVQLFRSSSLLGPILLAILFCVTATPGNMPLERGRVTGNVSFQGKPVTRALVVAELQNSEQKTTLTDAEGHYVIEVSPGTYLVTVLHPEYIVNDGGIGCKLIEIRTGASLTVDFDLNRGGVISGTVSDVREQPLVGQPVFYEIADKSFPQPCLMAGQADVRTDDQGAFRILVVSY